MRKIAIPTTLGFTLLLGLACGGPATPEDTWVLAGDDTNPGGGDDTNPGGDDTGIPGAEWVGTSWEMDLQDGTWTQPAGMGDLLGQYMEGRLYVFEVTQAQAGSLNLRVGESLEGSQDECVLTDLEVVSFDGEVVLLQEQRRVMEFEGAQLVMEDLILRGEPGEPAWSGVTMNANVDTRNLGELITEGGGPDEFCELMTGFGVTCTQCDDGKPYCMGIRIEDIPVTEFSAGVDKVEDCGDCWEEECREVGCATGPREGGLALALGVLGLIAIGRRRRD